MKGRDFTLYEDLRQLIERAIPSQGAVCHEDVGEGLIDGRSANVGDRDGIIGRSVKR